jgi:hypothetical protein
MQNPAETSASSDRKVAAPSAGNVAAPVPSSHSTPPHPAVPREVGGPSGPEPTRFGDWERKGRCIDF